MKVLRQFGVVTLLLVSFLTPAMACMVSAVPMSAEERACCQSMQNHCEQVGMSASHGCCRKTLQNFLDKAIVTKATHDHLFVAAAWLTLYECLQPSLVAAEGIRQSDYSPPQFPPGSNSILRI